MLLRDMRISASGASHDGVDLLQHLGRQDGREVARPLLLPALPLLPLLLLRHGPGGLPPGRLDDPSSGVGDGVALRWADVGEKLYKSSNILKLPRALRREVQTMEEEEREKEKEEAEEDTVSEMRRRLESE